MTDQHVFANIFAKNYYKLEQSMFVIDQSIFFDNISDKWFIVIRELEQRIRQGPAKFFAKIAANKRLN